MNAIMKRLKGSLGALAMPLVALGVLILFNLIRCAVIGDFHFFAISVASDDKGSVLSGNIISIIDSASVLAIISMGMTLVTAACGGQDISVGAVGAIAGAFFVIMMHPQHEEQLSTLSSVAWPNVILGIIAAIIAAIVFMLFNGTLVAYFKIQPMIATLILFSCGRSIAYYFLFQVLGVGSIKLDDPIIFAMGKVIPGVPIPTSIFIVILMGLLMWLVFKRTNLRLYTQAVGINQKAAQLNGINPTAVKLLSFVMLGVCVAVAAIVKCSNLGTLTTKSLMDSIEMDAILAVAIGGNNLGGGKFRLGGSILGAYTIQTLSTTLNAMQVSPDSMKAYKAIVIIVIMIAGSPVVRNWLVSVSGKIRMALRSSQAKEVE
jgi:simple sugar transport system permease protein